MKLISFNSYKGGACRTTTCYNTLPYLAKALGATKEQPILVFDVDLDSMGLTTIFHKEGGRNEGKPLKYSARHLFIDDSESINYDIQNYGLGGMDDEYFTENFERVGEALGLDDAGAVLFCGADEHAPSLSDDSFRYREYPPVNYLIHALKKMEKPPKAIVFDCASGVQMSTLAILSNVQRVVMCMRPTYQFRIGTGDYLREKIPHEIGKNTTNEIPEVILVPTSVPATGVFSSDPARQKAEAELVRLQKEAIGRITDTIVSRITNEEDELGFKLNYEMAKKGNFGLPEIERFKWEEDLLYRIKKEQGLTEQEELLNDRYAQLADILARE